MASAISSPYKYDNLCPVCKKEYTEENMVECIKCNRWCHYECVGVDDRVEKDELWKCPECLKSTTLSKKSKTKSQKTFRSNVSTISSNTRLKLQLIQEEKELLRQERMLTRESRKILDEDSSQDISDNELEEANPVINQLLSLQIETNNQLFTNEIEKTETNNGIQRQIPTSINAQANNQLTTFIPPISSLNTPNPRLDQQQSVLKPIQQTTYQPHHIINADPCTSNNAIYSNAPKINNVSPTIHNYYETRKNGVPGDLPYFSGNPCEWPLFYTNFERSTKLFNISNEENLIRLQKCLKGTARSTVSSFLILPECVPEIISTLKILFGRPEQIINSHIEKIKNQPSPKPEKLETLVEFGLSVKNLCVSLNAAGMGDYLNNPTLMHELVEKLPTQIKVNWALYRSTLVKTGLTEFADWLFSVSINVCTALPNLSLQDEKPQVFKNFRTSFRPERTNSHDTEIFKCKICDNQCSNVTVCQTFLETPIYKRWEIVRQFSLCKLCLKRHRFPCKYPVKCDQPSCIQKHHPLLHKESEEETSTSNLNQQQVNATSSTPTEFSMTQIGTKNALFRIVPITISYDKQHVKTFAFLDEGSSVTLLNEGIAKKLNLPGEQEDLCLKWTGDQKRLEKNSRKVKFSIAGDFHGSKDFTLRSARTVEKLNLPEQTLDIDTLKIDYPYLKNIPVSSYQTAIPDILIGLDNWDLALPLKVKEGGVGQPIAAKCRLGWTIFSLSPNYQQDVNCHYNYHVCTCNEETITNQQLFEAVKEYFSIESLGVQSTKLFESKEMLRAKQIQENTLIQKESEYKIGLLWKYDHLKLPDSKGMALQRLECIERKIKVNPELGIKMNEQLKDFMNKNYIRKLTEEELSHTYEKTWYLPIFPVFNPNKPNKFRIVWDAAAKVKGISLNSVLLKGDDQLASLLGVLLRFRERNVGFSADIKEMFLRVGIIEEDQHAQRFLWRNGNPNNPLETYVMAVMTFGATCSPSNAQFVKNTNAEKYKLEFPRAVKCIHNNHYVDDLLDSADTEDDAIEMAKQVTMIHAKANFEIRNWCSNSQKLNNIMNNTPPNEKVEMNLEPKDQNITEKVLGMWWDLKSDSFVFSLRFNKGNKNVLDGERKPTKREVLQILMSIYDPLGLISNFVIYLKIFLQEIWRSKISWDDPITDEQNIKWLIWLKQLPKIEKIAIPRCYLTQFPNWRDLEVQLHIFVDASEYASSTVAYLRIKKQNVVECTLLGSKTHVAPLKPQTIPRLELDSAVMGARFAKTLCHHLSISFSKITYWSDSIITLSWLRIADPRKLKKYVSFRVAEVQENSMISNWRYVPTKLNVADEATKWSNQLNLQINDRWFKGPEFLYELEEMWPIDLTIKEEKIEELFLHNQDFEPLIKFDMFHKFKILLNTVAYIHRFLHIYVRAKKENTEKTKLPQGNFTSEELLKARNTLFRLVQKEYYQDEIKALQKANKSELELTVKKSSVLYKLSPYLDHDGLLRVRGRIDAAICLQDDTKRPIILPRESPVSLLIVEEYHRKYLHRNHETVVNEIRQRYYIPKLRRVVNKVKTNCQFCKIKNAIPQVPEMSPLPECRLATFTAPFTFIGVDYFGPINVTVGRRIEKRWGALFTCLTIRAVHLEIATKLDTDSCILCFTNFINRRGRPRHIYCDRGTNFIGTERILKEEIKKIDPKLIANAFVNPELSFHFNSPLSPHMAGAWERLVKAVKISLYDALPSRTPTDSLLQSCLVAAENIVNSRPLTYLPLDSEESEALTPNHFILGSSNGDKPMTQINDDAKVLKYNFLYREQFANKCWQRFVSEYLPSLLLRPKWHKQVNPIKKGDLVIICDKDLPRCNWPKGRVIEVKTSKDGQVRKARVQTSNGIFERPVVKLAVISVENENTYSSSV